MNCSVVVEAAVPVYDVETPDEALRIAISKTGEMLNPDLNYVEIAMADRTSPSGEELPPVFIAADEALVALELEMTVFNVERAEHASRIARKEIGQQLDNIPLEVVEVDIIEDDEKAGEESTSDEKAGEESTPGEKADEESTPDEKVDRESTPDEKVDRESTPDEKADEEPTPGEETDAGSTNPIRPRTTRKCCRSSRNCSTSERPPVSRRTGRVTGVFRRAGHVCPAMWL